MLRQARLYTQLSAYHAMRGAFDYNITPLSLPVTRVRVHENTKQRATWDDNGVEIWYIGPSIRVHYHCYWFYIAYTGGERVCDTVQLFPSKIAMPALSSQENDTHSIHDIINIMSNTGPATPFLEYGTKATTTIEQLADIFSNNTIPKQQYPYPPTEHHTNIPIA